MVDMQMPDTQIVSQHYTLRDHLKTPQDIVRTLLRIAETDSRAAELSLLRSLDALGLKRILDRSGLAVCATHVGYERLRDELDGVIDEHQTLGCDYIGIGSIPNDYRSGEGYARFAREASEVARRMKERGVAFGYHNHS